MTLLEAFRIIVRRIGATPEQCTLAGEVLYREIMRLREYLRGTVDDREDAAHDLVVKLWRGVHSRRTKDPDSDDTVRYWLLRGLTHAFLHRKRRKPTLSVEELPLGSELRDPRPNQEDELVEREQENETQQFLQTLARARVAARRLLDNEIVTAVITSRGNDQSRANATETVGMMREVAAGIVTVNDLARRGLQALASAEERLMARNRIDKRFSRFRTELRNEVERRRFTGQVDELLGFILSEMVATFPAAKSKES